MTHATSPVPADTGLYLRGAETLLASWEEYPSGATGAAVQPYPGVAAVFPNKPEPDVYNNALLERGLADADRDDAVEGDGDRARSGRRHALCRVGARERRGDARRSRPARLHRSTRRRGRSA